MTIESRPFSPESPHEETVADITQEVPDNIIQFPDRIVPEAVEAVERRERREFIEQTNTNLTQFQDNIKSLGSFAWPKELESRVRAIKLDISDDEQEGFEMVRAMSQKSEDELRSLGTSREAAKDLIAISREGDLFAKVEFIDKQTHRSSSLPWERIKPGDIHEEHLPYVSRFLELPVMTTKTEMSSLRTHLYNRAVTDKDRNFW